MTLVLRVTIQLRKNIICTKCILNSEKLDNCYVYNNYHKFYLLKKKLQISNFSFKLVERSSLQILNDIFKLNLHKISDLAHAKLQKNRAG